MSGFQSSFHGSAPVEDITSGATYLLTVDQRCSPKMLHFINGHKLKINFHLQIPSGRGGIKKVNLLCCTLTSRDMSVTVDEKPTR